MNKELSPIDIELPDGLILKRTISPESISYDILKYVPNVGFEGYPGLGGVTAHNSFENPDELITMVSGLSKDIERKGIGRQLYKQAEKDTGKKIIPDLILSDKSVGLHRKYGLGKEFGLSSYMESIKRYATKLAEEITKERDANSDFPPPSPDSAEKVYQKFKDRMKANGLDNFKSIAPTLLKGAGVAGAMFAPSADAAVSDAVVPGGVEEVAISDERAIPDPKYQEYIKKKLMKRKK